MTRFADIADEEEDERIRIIGENAHGGGVVAFVTDDEPGKAERYIKKLLALHPTLEVTERGTGPVVGTVYVKVKFPRGN